jgi:hypothetical protein
MNLTERVRARHARERAKVTDNRTKAIEERAVDTILDSFVGKFISVTRLEEVSTMSSIKSRTDLHLVPAKRLEGDKIAVGVPIRYLGRNILR